MMVTINFVKIDCLNVLIMIAIIEVKRYNKSIAIFEEKRNGEIIRNRRCKRDS